MKTIRAGNRGPEVAVLQSQLNAHPGSSRKPLAVDGIFGPLTDGRTREFQSSRRLVVDGIAGRHTWAAVLDIKGPPVAACYFCDDPNPARSAASAGASSSFVSSGVPSATMSAFGFGLPSLPSLPKTRPLNAAEIALAKTVYGSSIDFSSVLVSDTTGLGGRAFVLTVPVPFGTTKQIMNVGKTPTHNTMIHELAHVWQSQHHSDPTRYMVNAVESQALAEATNLIKGVKSFSAYGYVPGKPFGSYAAEQIAQQVMRREASIVAHVRAVAPRAVDPANVASLKTPRIEDTSLPGVRT